MATDHDFRIKNGLQVENGFLLIGKQAFSSSDGYMGIKTSNMSGVNDYMMISGTGDNNTYISAKTGASVIVRSGGNTSTHQLVVSSAGASFDGNLTVAGNFTVNGTTTTLNTATLNVEDKNIVLNYGSGDTSGSANGAGITIQDAVNGSTDATILWDQSDGEFDFSHGISFPDNKIARFGTSSDLRIYHSGTESWIKDSGSGSLYIDTDGPSIQLTSGSSAKNMVQAVKDGAVNLFYNNSQKLATTSAGINITGTLSTSGLTSIAASGTNSVNALKLHVGAINNTGSSAIAQFGGFIRASDYYILHATAGSTDSLFIDYVGDDMDITQGEGSYNGGLRANAYRIGSGGTTVIDSSRNLLNIGTISSGAITSTGRSTFDAVTIDDDGSGSPLLRVVGDDHSPWLFQLENASATNDGLFQAYINNSNNLYFRAKETGAYPTWYFQISNASNHVNSMYLNSSGINSPGHVDVASVKISTTTVIDSSRNLSNIGTISSGAITASGSSVFNPTSDMVIVNEPSTNTDLQTAMRVGTAAGGLFFTTNNAIISKGAYYDGGWIATSTTGSSIDFTGNDRITFNTFSGATVGGTAAFGARAYIDASGLNVTGTGAFSGKLTINNASYANHLELVRGSDTLYLTPSGGQLITNGGLSPDVTNQDDLGRTDKYWANLWLGTSLKMGGTVVIDSSRNLTNIGYLDAASYVEGNNFKVNTVEVIDTNRVLKNITRADFANMTVTGTSTTAPSMLRYANIAANPEGSHLSHPYFFNDLANFEARGGTVTIGGLNFTPATTNVFKANGNFASWSNSNYSGSTMTITLTNLPRPISYGGYIGIAFGNTTWAPSSVKIEISTDGGSNWTTRLNDSSSKELYFTTTGTGGTALNAIRFTIGQASNSSIRVTNIWAYNYNTSGMHEYFLDKAGGTLLGTLNIASGAFQVGGTTVITSGRGVENVTLQGSTTGARFQSNNWFYDDDNDGRLYFALNGPTYYKSTSGHRFRANGDITRVTIDAAGAMNLVSGGDNNAPGGAALAVAGTTVIDTSRNLTNVTASGDIITSVTTTDDASWHDVVIYSSSGLRRDTAVEVHGSGYLRASYLNMTHSAGNRTADSVFFSSNDTYIRKNTASGFRTSLDVYSKAESVALFTDTGDIDLGAGSVLTRSNHHTGHMEGSYNNVGNNASKSNPIYTIGSGYNPTDAALSNMYGIGYANKGQATYLSGFRQSGWGMYVASDGDARVFLNAQTGVVASTAGYDVGATNVIDSSRNLTNIGTISSGAITSSGSVVASGNSNSFGNTTVGALSAGAITSSGDVKLNGDTKKFAAPVYRDTVTGISNSGYTTLFTVDGGGLASTIKMTLGGTTGSVVVNVTADISVNHYQDILITSQSGFYTTVTLKVISNNNEDFAVQAKTNSANSVNLTCEVFPLNNELVTFTTSHSFTGKTHEHECYHGIHTSGTGGNDGDLTVNGRTFLQDGSATSPALTFRNDTNTGFYRIGSDKLGFVTGGAYRGMFDNSGNLLVGTTNTTPGVGNSTAGLSLFNDGRIFVSKSANTPMSLNRNTNDGNILELRKDGSTVGSIGVINNDNLKIGGSVADHAGLQFALHEIVPMEANVDSDGTINLGSTNSKFKDLYLNGNIVLSGSSKIYMQGASGTDYLEFDDDSTSYTTSTNSTVLASKSDVAIRTNTNDGGGGRLTVVTGNSSPSNMLVVESNGNATFSGELDAVNGFEINGTSVIDASRNLANIGTITASGTVNLSGALLSTNAGANAIKTRFISGAASSSTSDGNLYIQHGKTNNILCFNSTSGNPSFQVYGNDNGTQRSGSLQIGTDGSFNITASDTYLLLNAGSYVQSNKPHNFTQGILFDGTSVINDSRHLANVTVTSAEAESGQSLNGNFGQWQSHSTYTNFNTDVNYWGWNFVQGNTNAPHTASSQWYRNRVSLGSGYGHGLSSGDYWLEVASPRLSHANGGHMYVRACENGSIGSWYEVGSNLRSSLNVGVVTSADINLGATTTNARLIIKKADNNQPDHIQIFCGSTQTGEIGSQDTTWLRINQTVAKNIYTPRYIRADSGFFVDNSSTGLDGSGRLRAFAGSNSSVGIGFANDINTGFTNPSADTIDVVTAGDAHARFDSTGNLIVEGNVTAYGSVSDIRLKENIEVIPDAVEKVQKLEGITFNYKKDGGRSTGLIAQQLQEVLPEAVYKAKDLDEEEHLAVKYGNVVGLLVEAIKEQQTQLTAQQEQINQLTTLVNTLMEK